MGRKKGTCYKDITNQKFGKLTAIKFVGYNQKRTALWLCKCDCGNVKIIEGASIRSGNVKSCGCLNKEDREKIKINIGDKYGNFTILEKNSQKARIYYKCKCNKCGKIFMILKKDLLKRKTQDCGCGRHLDARNGKHNKLYDVHQAMKQRCLNPNQKFYKLYGGRGIRVCDEWLDYKNFKEWALNNGYKEGLDLDRINNNGNYEPSNCRWITHKANCNNRSTCRTIKIKGEKYTVEDIMKKYNLSKSCIYNRLKRGDKEEELIRPSGTRKDKLCG